MLVRKLGKITDICISNALSIDGLQSKQLLRNLLLEEINQHKYYESSLHYAKQLQKNDHKETLKTGYLLTLTSKEKYHMYIT